MDAIESIILQHPQRGMDILAPHMSESFCRDAAEYLYALPRGKVLLATGFYVRGFAETDGPAGVWAVANALKEIGFTPVIVTDTFLEGVFESCGFETEYFPFDGGEKEADALLAKHSPVCLFSLERCGRTEEGDYVNMLGLSIREHTAPVDELFNRAYGKIPTIGVGDGGNEIGMGNLHDIVKSELSCAPSAVKVDKLIIATVSNWGGYGFTAYFSLFEKKMLVPSFEEQQEFLEMARKAVNCIDGVHCEHTLTEDGYPAAVSGDILLALRKEVKKQLP